MITYYIFLIKSNNLTSPLSPWQVLYDHPPGVHCAMCMVSDHGQVTNYHHPTTKYASLKEALSPCQVMITSFTMEGLV